MSREMFDAVLEGKAKRSWPSSRRYYQLIERYWLMRLVQSMVNGPTEGERLFLELLEEMTNNKEKLTV